MKNVLTPYELVYLSNEFNKAADEINDAYSKLAKQKEDLQARHVALAVMTEHVEGKKENEIIEVLQKGYTYKDKVIRPAMVKVNN